MKLIKDRDRRTIYRKLKKEEYDEKINLSASTYRMRLLDEGMVVTAEGNPQFYIPKGSLSAYLEAFPEDIEGTINLGHMPFANFPIILGTWDKSDLELVELDNGFTGVDVVLHLNTDLNIVQDLLKMPYDLGISAEVFLTWDQELTELVSEKLGTYVPVAKSVYFEAFAVVGDAGNVNSFGLKGE